MLVTKITLRITAQEEWKPTMLMPLKCGLKGHLSYGDQPQLGIWTNQKRRLSAEDPEVKKETHVCVTSLKDDILLRLENRISNWNKMKRIVGMVLQ